MASLFNYLCGRRDDALTSGDEVHDEDATNLTHVGRAAYD
jgi:hypothetical protein